MLLLWIKTQFAITEFSIITSPPAGWWAWRRVGLTFIGIFPVVGIFQILDDNSVDSEFSWKIKDKHFFFKFQDISAPGRFSADQNSPTRTNRPAISPTHAIMLPPLLTLPCRPGGKKQVSAIRYVITDLRPVLFADHVYFGSVDPWTSLDIYMTSKHCRYQQDAYY